MISYIENELYSSQNLYNMYNLCHSVLKMLTSWAGQVHEGATRGFEYLSAVVEIAGQWDRTPRKDQMCFPSSPLDMNSHC